MSEQDFDNIPLLNDLIKKGEQTEQTEQTEQKKLLDHSELEHKIHDILQRHTSQATAEIIAIINAKQDNIE